MGSARLLSLRPVHKESLPPAPPAGLATSGFNALRAPYNKPASGFKCASHSMQQANCSLHPLQGTYPCWVLCILYGACLLVSLITFHRSGLSLFPVVTMFPVVVELVETTMWRIAMMVSTEFLNLHITLECLQATTNSSQTIRREQHFALSQNFEELYF